MAEGLHVLEEGPLVLLGEFRQAQIDEQAELVREVVPALIEEGYRFVRLDQMPEYRQYETPGARALAAGPAAAPQRDATQRQVARHAEDAEGLAAAPLDYGILGALADNRQLAK